MGIQYRIVDQQNGNVLMLPGSKRNVECWFDSHQWHRETNTRIQEADADGVIEILVTDEVTHG